MAAVINSLWEKGDRYPLIMPGNVPIDDPRVQSELTRLPASPLGAGYRERRGWPELITVKAGQ